MGSGNDNIGYLLTLDNGFRIGVHRQLKGKGDLADTHCPFIVIVWNIYCGYRVSIVSWFCFYDSNPNWRGIALNFIIECPVRTIYREFHD
ncbi:MAG: hypothetical protein DDT25_01013 [Chloroflexi bacterium]|nr:hypothetical protein [Chloroflexota bacterium]